MSGGVSSCGILGVGVLARCGGRGRDAEHGGIEPQFLGRDMARAIGEPFELEELAPSEDPISVAPYENAGPRP